MKTFLAKFKQGDSFFDIIRYWLPEIISQTILITLPPIIDSFIVAQSQSLTTYGAMAMATNFLHSLTKFSEAIPVASIAIIGRYNGNKEYKKCGEYLGDTFWTTTLLGLAQFLLIFIGATSIYLWLGVPYEMAIIGAPYLRFKALGVLLIFTSIGLLGFMRAVKNTHIPMTLYCIGVVIFIFFDYSLVLGKFGFPCLQLRGSAIATILQYGTITLLAALYIVTNQEYKKYFSRVFFSFFDIKRSLHILGLSWRIMIDKSCISLSYVWLSKLLAGIGTYAIASYDVVKNLERFAFLPVMASATILTFLVSNRLGAQDPEGAASNIKKTLILTACTVIPSLLYLCVNARYFASLFDPKNKFTDFAAATLPIISILVIFDSMQVILAGALRGAGDVKTVMWTRFFACFFFFVPISYVFSILPINNPIIRFILIYGSFYITTGLIGLIFLLRIKSHKWEHKTI